MEYSKAPTDRRFLNSRAESKWGHSCRMPQSFEIPKAPPAEAVSCRGYNGVWCRLAREERAATQHRGIQLAAWWMQEQVHIVPHRELGDACVQLRADHDGPRQLGVRLYDTKPQTWSAISVRLGAHHCW